MEGARKEGVMKEVRREGGMEREGEERIERTNSLGLSVQPSRGK